VVGRVEVAVALLAACCAASARAADLPITAKSAIVIDAANGDLLYERDPDRPLPPASTTKIVTAILAIESGRLDDALPVSSFAAETPPSKIHLQPGQQMALRHLLYALLLNSANDAAVVIAEGLAGSQEAFAARMNARARKLGAMGSHFENPHGLTADGHVSTARDLARMFRYGLSLPLFRDVLSTRTLQVPVEGDAGTRLVNLHSHNRLISGWTYPVIGKTGYTLPARRCFVGAASDGDREVIVALLGASDLWGDARKLIQFGLAGQTDFPTVLEASALPRMRLHGHRTKQLLAHGRYGKRVAKALLLQEHRRRMAAKIAAAHRGTAAGTKRARTATTTVATTRGRGSEGDDNGRAQPARTTTKSKTSRTAATAKTRTTATARTSTTRVKVSGRHGSAVAHR